MHLVLVFFILTFCSVYMAAFVSSGHVKCLLLYLSHFYQLPDSFAWSLMILLH